MWCGNGDHNTDGSRMDKLEEMHRSRCSDFDYIRMDMSEQHANVRDSPSHTVT